MFNIFSFLIPKSKQIIEKGVCRNGVARVKCKNGLYNYVNTKGEFVFKEGFQQADEFNDVCTLADGKLININGEIYSYNKVERVYNHNGLFAAWKHGHTRDMNKCAFINSKGQLLTNYDYTDYSARPDGTIHVSHRRVERSLLNMTIKESWYTILDATMKEIIPRLGYDKKHITDSLYICYIYNENIHSYCLYDSESNAIISENIVSYIPDKGHYIKMAYKEGDDCGYCYKVLDTKYGIVDSNMNPIIDCSFDMITTSASQSEIYDNDPESLFTKSQNDFTANTSYYIVTNKLLKGLYTDAGKCIMEPRYKKLASTDHKNFIAETDNAICVYSEKDGFIRVIVQHKIIYCESDPKLSFIERKYRIIESKHCNRFLSGYVDNKTGKVGLIDDKLNIILDPIYDSIDYNGESFTAWKDNISKRYFLDQYLNDNDNTFKKLDLSDFPIENIDEISNRNILNGKPQTILFFDTETNGLPEDYKAPSQDVENWPRAVQLSWIITDDTGVPLKKRNYYIRPDGFAVIEKSMSNPYAIPEITLLNKGVDIKKVLEEFSEDIHRVDLIVGHNIKFDKNVIQAELYRLSKPDIFTDKQMYCTMIAGKQICEIISEHGFKYPKLQELYQHLFKKNFEGAHDASNDVVATIECFFKIWQK